MGAPWAVHPCDGSIRARVGIIKSQPLRSLHYRLPVPGALALVNTQAVLTIFLWALLPTHILAPFGTLTFQVHLMVRVHPQARAGGIREL